MESRHNENVVYPLLAEHHLFINTQGEVWRDKPVMKRAEYALKGGYREVRIEHGGQVFRCLAHRLVWRHFKGEIPGQLTVNHKNGIKTDNRIDNLELATMSEQRRHRYDVLNLLAARGDSHYMAKLNAETVRKLRAGPASTDRIREFAVAAGCSCASVYDAYNRRTWRHVA